MLASFPSNELNTPLGPVVALVAILLVGVLYLLFRSRSLFFGTVIGAIVFACIAGLLFWPRELREPRAPNPGPTVVFAGAVVGGLFGFASALLGKIFARVGKHLASLNRDTEDPTTGDLEEQSSSR